MAHRPEQFRLFRVPMIMLLSATSAEGTGSRAAQLRFFVATSPPVAGFVFVLFAAAPFLTAFGGLCCTAADHSAFSTAAASQPAPSAAAFFLMTDRYSLKNATVYSRLPDIEASMASSDMNGTEGSAADMIRRADG